MGVPKFYRWLSERYPKINQIISDNALLPEFDHLYLDMNGIIHGCTHPSHMDISDVLSERDMMLGIMHYLDRIITQIVKPKVSVYMAIDGVAPRAKLNQQRSRRFRSAKDTAEATKDLPQNEKNVFDSNCITPGTEFLAKVSEHIQYFIRKKLKEDPLWHGLTVIFSGHDIPGEGEHKIMQHIRELRSQPGYQPNNRHCIYGQDADLIMLSLITHEPHFTILREVIDFNFGRQQQNTLKAVKKFTKESDFQLLHVSILREYLQIEFCREDPQYDLERTIDDFVFMTFLVGNDFLPHLPALDIADGAFDLLFSVYKKQRVDWGEGNYLTKSGEVSDPHRLEVFVEAIGAVETDVLEAREKEEATYAKKKRRWDKRDGKEEGPSDAELAAVESEKQNDYLSMMETLMQQPHWSSENFVAGWTPVEESGQKDFKGRYYFEKLKFTPLDKDKHWALRRSYMEGLMWCLAYYYKGCISWGWFYPYHYGPMLSDLIDIPRMFAEIKFELGEPLKPFQQLMGCLPPASSALVPKPYRLLMQSPDSPIIQFYPSEFEVDMNGKKNPWEGVNLLPFIDIALLKSTIEKFCPDSILSTAESVRNSMGTVYCYKHDPTSTGTIKSPNPSIGLPDISVCHSTVSVIEVDEAPSTSTFEPKLVNGTQIPYPGFPSLNVLPIASIGLTKAGLNCFGFPSKYLNTILHLTELPELAPIDQLADSLLGKSVFVNWPMMHEAKVIGLSNELKEIKVFNGKRKHFEFGKIEVEKWRADSKEMLQLYHVGNGIPGSGGVDIGPVRLRLKVQPLQGMKTNPNNGSKKKFFGQQEADVPLQLCLLQAPAPDPRFVERGPSTLQDRFPSNCQVVLTKGKYRGCKGTVISIADTKNVAVNVQIIPPETPFGLFAVREVQESYMSSTEAAKMLKMNAGVLGKVMGRLQFEQGKFDLGLNLKTADGMCVPGYTRKKVESARKKGGNREVWSAGDTLLVIGSQKLLENGDKDERIQWEYTPRAVKLVNEYRKKFPQLFTGIMKNSNEKRYDANAIFGNNGEAWLPIIRDWLDKHESAKIPRSPVTTESMPREAVAKVEKYAAIRNLALQKKGYPKESLIKIPGSALYREGSIGATDVLLAADLNSNEAPELGDRIVNLCVDGIPFGAKGTVIGIHEAATTGCVEVVMDEEFMGGTSLQGACSNFRGRLCLWAHLLKVTPENASALVDKMVPKSSEKANSDRMRTIVNNQLEQHKESGTSWDGRQDESLSPKRSNIQMPRQQNEEKAHSKSPLRPQAKPRSASRDGSTARGKQGAWEQARGPDEKNVGFQGKRTAGKSGFKQWKEIVTRAESSSQDEPRTVLHRPTTQTSSTSTEAATLKAMLGLQPTPARKTLPLASAEEESLKAMLGLQPTPAHNAVPMASATSGQHIAQQTPSSAAEKLRALMISSRSGVGSRTGTVPFGQGQVRTAFNFTYVEEGQELPPVGPVHVPGPIAQQHPMMYAPMGPGRYPLPIPGYSGFVPPQHGMMPPVFNTGGIPAHRASVNEEDFPALGSEPSQQVNGAGKSRVQTVMVPSAVASKPKR